ncbi:unnamed protein product [Paramecium pentaurelia]|uniref:Uncharacterized protein n=1 Tax=Paramecium pentaurelia TaxID=43138 RepID=A0A8S1XL17_9CILI|nr:unnamed protein product [Paramecium pentaurelia]
MGCIINLNKIDLSHELDQDPQEDEQPLNKINNTIQIHIMEFTQKSNNDDSALFLQKQASTYPIVSNYSNKSNSNSIKSCLKPQSGRSLFVKEDRHKTVQFNQIIKVVTRNKVFYLRRIRRSKNKKTKIDLDEIF